MKRRIFLTLGVVVVALMPLAAAADSIDYTPGVVAERLAAGETVFLDFKASWCVTCKAQERVMKDLRAEDPAYDAAMTFVTVDWDSYETDPLTISLNIPRRSTLVVLRGDKELGRIVAGTSRDEIKELMEAGLGGISY